MKIEQTKLISELRDFTQEAKAQVLEFKTYPLAQLNYKSSDVDWSILECIEHLCLYGKFYLPEIENRIKNLQPTVKPHFKSGILGNYFVNMIKASNPKKIKATKQMDSTGSELSVSTIDQFLKQLEWLDSLLIKSETTDLTKVKTSISLTNFIRLRLGDTLRFVVYHNERHIEQAERIKIKASS
jgi:hypothetical protein